jgi:hypothetical protein
MKKLNNLINFLPAFFILNIVNRNKQVYDFFSKSGKILKHVLICYCYGQKDIQRLDYFTKAFEGYTARKSKSDEKKAIEEFVFKYKNFIKFCLSGKST